jgi:hypothetical protein
MKLIARLRFFHLMMKVRIMAEPILQLTWEQAVKLYQSSDITHGPTLDLFIDFIKKNSKYYDLDICEKCIHGKSLESASGDEVKAKSISTHAWSRMRRSLKLPCDMSFSQPPSDECPYHLEHVLGINKNVKTSDM